MCVSQACNRITYDLGYCCWNLLLLPLLCVLVYVNVQVKRWTMPARLKGAGLPQECVLK